MHRPSRRASRCVGTVAAEERQVFRHVILLISSSLHTAPVSSGVHELRRIRKDRIGMRVVALPGDDVDADRVADAERRRVGHVAGEGVLTEDVARQLVAEVAGRQPRLVR